MQLDRKFMKGSIGVMTLLLVGMVIFGASVAADGTDEPAPTDDNSVSAGCGCGAGAPCGGNCAGNCDLGDCPYAGQQVREQTRARDGSCGCDADDDCGGECGGECGARGGCGGGCPYA